MNLIGDAWIPVVFQNGQTRSVGLKNLYEQAEAIRDLALAPPHRIAVMRFLICITQAALDGPADKDEWLECKGRIIPESLAYLEKHRGKFDLFGEQPFLQIRDLAIEKEEDKPALDKLDFRLSSGNNKTWRDQEAISEGRKHPAAWCVLQLLTFLNFSTQGRVGQANWKSIKFSQQTFAAPCVKVIHIFPRKQNFLETLQINLLTKTQVSQMPNSSWGCPVWDSFPENPKDKSLIENTTKTYLGRLVPLTRLIKLSLENNDQDIVQARCIIGPLPKNISFEGVPSFREASTIVVERDGKHRLLTLSTDKHIWRDLGAVLALKKADQDDGSFVLHNIPNLDADKIDIWVGGLLPGQADIDDAIEWNLSIPTFLFQDTQITRYKNSVGLAEENAKKLASAVYEYLNELKAYTGRDQTSVRRKIANKATMIYWQELDQRYGLLLEDRPVDKDWRRIIRDALSNAYEQSCVHETPRQIQAFVAGQKRLGLHKLMTEGGADGGSE